MKREMSLADGRIWRNVLPMNPRVRRKRPSRFFFFFSPGRAYSVSYMAPSHKFPTATITALRVVENIFQAQLSGARQRRSASSFFFRPSRDLATFLSTGSLRISLSLFMLHPRSSCREGYGCVGRARNCARGWHANAYAGRSRGVYFGTPPRARSPGR